MNESSLNGHTHDVVIVGAGISGMYMLHRARQFGLDAIALEAGSGVGGTWYWNRYPGARCDIQSLEYSYSFDEKLQQEWHWPEKYSSQADILEYLNHVCDRFGLRSGIELDTHVESATFDESLARWHVTTNRGVVGAQFLVMATGVLSAANTPDIPGLHQFTGQLLHTARWPHEPVDFTGKRVAVIGTGSSGVQVAPEIARQASHLYVLQRTASHSLPSNNGPLDPDVEAAIKADYTAFREANRRMPSATGAGDLHAIHDISALDVDAEERRRAFEASWTKGGFTFTQTYKDLVVDRQANALASEFICDKIHSIVRDPAVAEMLMPKVLIGCKRMCIDSGYYDMFNLPNVELVDVSQTPIAEIGEHHLRVGERQIEVDAIVFATGFDAMTGSLLRVDLHGRGGVSLRDAWADGPGTYLGLFVHGFPNLFTITGPGSPSALTNVIMSAEHHVEWVADCIDHMRLHGHRTVESTSDAQRAWGEHVAEVASTSLRTDPSCNSWYLGSNIAGKKRQFMLLLGFPAYVERCAEIAANGYEGLEFDATPPRSDRPER
jgi:cation diffusion facilitator CzcD-associated flavoprotein CzcO